MSQSQTERAKVGHALAVLLDNFEQGKDVPFNETPDGKLTLSVRLSSNRYRNGRLIDPQCVGEDC